MPRVYRHKIGHNVLEKLLPFARLHADLPSKEFKTKWEIWCMTNELLISGEEERLVADGYAGDVVAKLYRSARYYFKKKPPALDHPSLPPPRKPNAKQYISLSPVILSSMDLHLRETIHDSLSPATLYSQYIATHTHLMPLLTSEAHRLRTHAGLSDNEILLKLKKTYKNRYNMIVKKLDQVSNRNASRTE